jgi:hypothetical protein
MSAGGWIMLATIVLTLVVLGFVVFSMIRSIANERSPGKGIMREFGLGIALFVLFLASWFAHGVAEWQTYTDDQRTHGESTSVGDFVSHFSQSTLENWQSEFLQLFAFVSLAALYVHKGSAESKDSDERLEAAVRRIEERLGTLPDHAPQGDESWQLPDPVDQS